MFPAAALAADDLTGRGETPVSWDFSTEPEFSERLAWMRAFVVNEVFPLETIEWTPEQWKRVSEPLKQQVRDAGLWAAHLPPELGGMGFGLVKLGLMYEIIGMSGHAAEIFGNAAPDSGNAVMMANAVTPEQRRTYLQPLLAGELRSAFSMTEPGAGSDPTMITTTAVRDGDSFVINGHKWFTSNGSVADFLLVMCLTDPDAPPRERFSIIIVPAKTPGVDIKRDIPNMENPEQVRWRPGRHTHAEIVYSGVRVPAENLLGARGQGFRLAQSRLGPARTHRCMEWIGLCHRAFDMMCERAVSRRTFGSALADKQTVQNWIAESAAQIQAARLMTLYAAWKIEQGGDAAARLEISTIKFVVANTLHDVIDRAIQVHGSLGFSADLPLEEMYRYARNARIVDGPDEVHRATAARLILRSYQAHDVPTEHVPTRRAAARERFAAVLTELDANA
jgi:acyl-CoA dehydrogenase